MKKLIYVTAILLFGLFAVACGGRTETKETENKQVSTAPNSNLVTIAPSANTANSNLALKRDDDDKGKKDADDLRSGNMNQNRVDRDNRNGKRDADDKNLSNTRRDADDSGKRENDGDDDDH